MKVLQFQPSQPTIKKSYFLKSNGQNIATNPDLETDIEANKQILVAISKTDRLERIVLWLSVFSASAQIITLLIHILPKIDKAIIVK